ncbi:xanthine dehydrogenase YagR molybdenum-binding subunit [Mycolicibacterium rutilum]|uniref:Xanthine dehydrogenase YagR molybdenum-binding subunit n=1 Tax=Mycolicibacterium rutilum TaxID=370526 RepID=A0A1H6LRQ5_MYCRU|nr:xanthine dehydrogenase family protein molybdopterin-binding subunit [Mycolicibacterium rutilum]SEH91419.1 xanthine dehydrogenase YagR molybdenum-binding subunit [Mycolicibacterium rutilum]
MTSPMAVPRFSGRPVTRVDGRLKVTGQATYAADNPVPDAVHAVLVCSTVARGGVTGVDTAAAQRHTDVVRVLTEFRGVTLPFEPRTITSFGQPVAVVVAETLEAAAHAATLVEVRYDAADPLTDVDAPQAQAEPGRTARTTDYARGDADAALRGAEVSTDLRFTLARNNHNPMELPSTIARWDGEHLTVWDKVQGITWSQEAYAEAFGLSADQVHVLSPFVGGAFGGAGRTWPHGLLAAYAARELGRPVKVTLTRRQFYTTVGYRPTSRQRLAIGADRSGRITGVIHEGRVEKSRHDGYEDNVTGVPRFMYSAPHLRSTYRTVPLDVNPPTFTRAPGTVSGVFALESALDDLAFRLGMDPIELRARNEPRRDESTDLPFSTRRLTECFAQGADTFGWSRRNATPRAVREGNLLVGFGTAAAVYHANAVASAASVRINRDGTADVQTGSIDMGPGTYTAMTQVAADALGLPLNRVRFALGDSRMPQAPVHSASQTMASVGSGVLHAANLLRDRFIRTAVVDPGSPLAGLRPDEVTVADGRMTASGGRGESYQDLLRRRGWGPLDATQTWSPDEAEQDAYAMHSYGAVFAEVTVDEQLGLTRVRRMYAVYDAGRIINPLLAHSQAIGGMVGGIGMALLESTDLDHRDGRIVNANMSDYLVPVNADIGDLDAAFLPGEDMLLSPLGVKGLAELVFVGVPAAIANAVFNATGRRVTDLPITLDTLI